MASPRRAARVRLACALCCAVIPTAGGAQGIVPVDAVHAHDDPDDNAILQAPTRAPLGATQPTSVLGSEYIQNNIPPQSDYAQIVALSPSVIAIEQNGPGNAFSGEVGIRGFQDGQYNVTLDGIPFGDSNNYTHHTSSYFMNRDLSQVAVDRGPGTASTIGDATFGGTIALDSKAPATRTLLTPYAAGGSFNTTLEGAELDTGPLPGGGALVIDGEHTASDGALSYAAAARTNLFGKYVMPLGPRTVLTVEGMYNTTDQYFDRGASRAQIARFGPNYGFSNDPKLQNYYLYNKNRSHSDFDYAGIRSELSDDWVFETKVYTYGYDLKGVRAIDVSNSTFPGTTYGRNDIPGTAQNNQYRAFGDTFQVTRSFPHGDVKVGGWVENQANAYSQANIDLTRGNILSPNSFKAFTYLDHEDLLTLQPYFELDLRPLPGLTITPGVKYDFFRRTLNAQVNVGTGQPLSYDKSYAAPLPAVTAHYLLTPSWAAYLQYAKGFLAPQLNYIQNADPTKTNVSPQQTNNYQVGTTYQTPRLSISGDLYYIDFSNMIASRAVGVNTIYFNQGAVDYYGVEAEGTLAVGHGVSLYANGSGNVARNRATGQPVANAPEATAAGGVIYVHGAIYASLLDKWVGSRYGDVGLRQGLDPFNNLGAAIAYTVHRPGVPPVALRLQFDNLLDSRKIDQFDLYAGSKQTPLYYVQAGRSVFASVAVPL
ncbi:MAG: TonB-dependent receptor [Janthinobacterium lividum]